MAKTMIDKIWDQHVIKGKEGEPQLLYVDLHLLHEVTSPQAFEGLRENNRPVRRTDKTFATMDHNVPTVDIFNVKDMISKKQIETLGQNCKDFGVRVADMGHADQGIIHAIGPQLGLTQPGMLIVCGDSHTATHGSFGSIAFGIGTSEVEHVLATQTLWQNKPKKMGIRVHGKLPKGVYAKDVIMGVIAREGVAFGTGYGAEFYGDTIRNMEMEERMTLCNMAIEGGAKMACVASDEKTYEYVRGRKYAPKNMEKAIAHWKQFYTDDESAYDKIIDLDATKLAPFVSWGTNPGMAIPIDKTTPEIKNADDQKAYDYVHLQPGQSLKDVDLKWIFFGSCTNGRLSDLKIAASILKGRHIAEGITAWVVPASRTIKETAEKLGIDKIFKDAGCEWREPGCSACLGMNPDHVPAGIHCASTSNRNFEGRQGVGSITHLASPAMVAAAAIHGHFIDIRKEAI
ncbi:MULTISPECIES: 3-isopropylmalate dehydratase large subunit [Lactobacillaceae]|uniref:3-isopropylmalate dehydratase large subunit n=1 Tax=Apilactobacillus kunkeei TaxID=148814 RepID=A0A0P7LZX6_9LACO|nr:MULTISPECIES: 3-isopropylmalate dehydratase large subunit [Lactobacillaceae]KPN84117.1 3-isopropylmalate dehydratase large subunit [Apilactobacillus kunkeei]MCX8743769.1 3-isopropylmalate dehydratase large subunit [Lactobacillus sp. B3795]